MRAKFTQSFKLQAVEKALSRNEGTTLNEIANLLGIGFSTLNNWIVKARNQEFEIASADEIKRMTQDKRPHDWSLEERLNIVVACSSLGEEELNVYCREQSIYPHHVQQWKQDFVSGNSVKESVVSATEMKGLRQENKTSLYRKVVLSVCASAPFSPIPYESEIILLVRGLYTNCE